MVRAALIAAVSLAATTTAWARPHPPDIAGCPDPRGFAPCDRPPPPPPPVELVMAPPPPPPAPGPPRWQSFGFRAGVARLRVAGHERMTFNYGLAWSVALAGRLHGFVEYDFVLIGSGDTMADGTLEDVHGRGHALATGLRVPLLTTLVGRDDDGAGIRLRPHIDLELGAAGLLASDDQLGAYVVPYGVLGARLGLELVRRRAAGSLRPGTADIHFTLRAAAARDAVTWAFALGMDWGG